MKFIRDFPKKIRVVANFVPPTFKTSLLIGGNKTIYAFDASLISLLMELLHFELDIFETSDMEFGRLSEDGNWTGLIGTLLRDEADLALGKVTITEERSQVVDFSYPCIFDSITFITDKPEYTSNRYAIFQPFTFFVWAAILTSSIIVWVASHVCKRYGRCKNSQSVFLITFGILLSNSIPLKPFKTVSRKLLISFWILCTMSIAFSYKTVLLSFLTFPEYSVIKDITELSQASESSSFKCGTYKGGYTMYSLNGSDKESWKRILQCVTRTTMFDKSMEDFMHPTSYKKAFIGKKTHLQTISRGYYISNENFFSIMSAVVVSKTFCCKEVLDEIILKTAAAGILDKFLKDETYFVKETPIKSKVEEPDHEKKLTLEDMFGAFMLLIFGHILAFIIFLIELGL